MLIAKKNPCIKLRIPAAASPSVYLHPILSHFMAACPRTQSSSWSLTQKKHCSGGWYALLTKHNPLKINSQLIFQKLDFWFRISTLFSVFHDEPARGSEAPPPIRQWVMSHNLCEKMSKEASSRKTSPPGMWPTFHFLLFEEDFSRTQSAWRSLDNKWVSDNLLVWLYYHYKKGRVITYSSFLKLWKGASFFKKDRILRWFSPELHRDRRRPPPPGLHQNGENSTGKIPSISVSSRSFFIT